MRESIIILAPTSLYTVLLYHDNFASIIKNVSRAWCVVLLPMPHNHTVCLDFPAFGKREMKRWGLSPDGAIQAAFQMVGGDVIGITQPDWHSAVHELDQWVYRKHRLQTEPWRRWANGSSRARWRQGARRVDG